MYRFLVVNLEIMDKFNNTNIAAACIDFHPNNIKEILNGHDGTIDVRMADGRFYIVIMPFLEFLTLIFGGNDVNITLPESVVDYLPHNWEAYKNRINYNKGDGTEENTA